MVNKTLIRKSEILESLLKELNNNTEGAAWFINFMKERSPCHVLSDIGGDLDDYIDIYNRLMDDEEIKSYLTNLTVAGRIGNNPDRAWGRVAFVTGEKTKYTGYDIYGAGTHLGKYITAHSVKAYGVSLGNGGNNGLQTANATLILPTTNAGKAGTTNVREGVVITAQPGTIRIAGSIYLVPTVSDVQKNTIGVSDFYHVFNDVSVRLTMQRIFDSNIDSGVSSKYCDSSHVLGSLTFNVDDFWHRRPRRLGFCMDITVNMRDHLLFTLERTSGGKFWREGTDPNWTVHWDLTELGLYTTPNVYSSISDVVNYADFTYLTEKRC